MRHTLIDLVQSKLGQLRQRLLCLCGQEEGCSTATRCRQHIVVVVVVVQVGVVVSTMFAVVGEGNDILWLLSGRHADAKERVVSGRVF